MAPQSEDSREKLPTLERYELLEKVGEGGMASVYKARHRPTGTIVAVKILAPEVARKPVLLKRFEQEFRAAGRLDHPNIVRSLDFDYHQGGPFLVMEYVEGESLGQRVEREGRFSEAEAVHMISQIAKALDYAHHRGVIHRDIKPDNILRGQNGQARLTDLGLVKQSSDDLDLTRPGQGLGTPNFMAPEQFSNAKRIDHRCDIYGLGATLYMLVTGELPFVARTPVLSLRMKAFGELTPPRQLVPELSEHAERAMLRAMSVDPNQRQGSCAEFVDELHGLVPERTAPLTPPKTPGPIRRTEEARKTPQAARPDKKTMPTLPAPSSAVSTPVMVTLGVPGENPAADGGGVDESSPWQWILVGLTALAASLVGFAAWTYLH
jgi:serine/threonine protein kinase